MGEFLFLCCLVAFPFLFSVFFFPTFSFFFFFFFFSVFFFFFFFGEKGERITWCPFELVYCLIADCDWHD